MILVNEKNNCCGCMACRTVCPTEAISMTRDENGFIYPDVNKELCIECGACREICAFSGEHDGGSSTKKAYAYKLNDKDILADSTSGGAFTAISDVILSEGGVVVGAVFDPGSDFEVCHIVAEDKAARDSMRRSKYVQSNTDGIFETVKEYLSQGRKVMFVGTPCQAAEMARYAGSDRKNLLICDFLCHGVPNNGLFIEHIRYLENYYGKKAVRYYFRSKKYGWSHKLEEIEFSDGTVKGSKRVQCYSRFFYSGVSIRPSCHNCKYRSDKKASDITIADFWGAESVLGGSTDNEGLSLIAVSTEYGAETVSKISRCGTLTEVPVKSIVSKFNRPAAGSTIDENEFWKLYKTSGYSAVVDKYTDTSVSGSIKHEIKKIVKKILNG